MTLPTVSKAPVNYDVITRFGPWLVIAVALTGAAQFDTTAQLAAAMAYLILVASVLWYGPAALTNINSLAKPTTTSTTQVKPIIVPPAILN
jgi:phosphotransferase system  glucose/maltose/N-acetylglucosamine-specific IIC component